MLTLTNFFSILFDCRKQGKTPGKKRKFAGVAVSQPNVEVDIKCEENTFAVEELAPPPVLPDISVEALIEESKIDQQLVNAINSIIQPDTELALSTEITPTATPIAMDMSENSFSESLPNQMIPSLEETPVQADLSLSMDTSTELPSTPISGNVTPSKICALGLISPTTPSVPKKSKRRIIIDDDDESPTFNPLRSTKKMRGKNRRKNLMLKKQQRKAAQLLLTSTTDKPNETAVFTSPEAIVSTVLHHNLFAKNSSLCDDWVYAPYVVVCGECVQACICPPEKKVSNKTVKFVLLSLSRLLFCIQRL